MKILAETTGSFALQDVGMGLQTIPAHRPAVVISSNFFQSRMGLGQIKMLGELLDTATDEAFKENIRASMTDGIIDMPLAVESFLSEFGVNAVTSKGDPEPEPEPELDLGGDKLKVPSVSGMKAADAKEVLNLFAIEHFSVELDAGLSVAKAVKAIEDLIEGQE